MRPSLSEHFRTRLPSAIRLSQIEFSKRRDSVVAINTAIGNVSLPIHPAIQKRMFELPKSPFASGIIKYAATVGEAEANQTFLHLIRASGFSTEGLYSQITEGGSQAMELVLLGVCGPAGSSQKPLLLIDPIYSNYTSMAERVGRPIAAITRHLEDDGKFSLPQLSVIRQKIEQEKPGALLIIPYDNPTGQFYDQETVDELGKLCVEYNLWMISDEAYRELFYTQGKASSIWGIEEKKVPGIRGRRISIESASKVWNGCGLRIGALITDHEEFHRQAVAENTANLCANVLGQYLFSSLLYESKENLQSWFQKQRSYYSQMATQLTKNLREKIPPLIVSQPDAALYTVVDARHLSPHPFDATAFVLYCARLGKVPLHGTPTTLLVAPMEGFYSRQPNTPNPGKTQMRIAYVEPPETMQSVPDLLKELFKQYLEKKS